MEIASTIREMQALRRKCSGAVGLVPTMGYLHQGHIELVKTAKKENPVAVVSIFVNPAQFAPNEDFRAYPRDINRDLDLLRNAETDIVFIPSVEDMYPSGYNTWVVVKDITERLEGKSRPTHFQGVTTVCSKLFNIVEPHKAYFGQKDAQQALLIQKMVNELNMNLEIIIAPTVRESNGLAMSSRNTYLDKEERAAAAVLYKALCLAQDMYREGEQDAAKIRSAMTGLISKEPRAIIDYVSIADIQTLHELTRIEAKALVSIAVKIGKPRLIDNIILG